MDKYYFDHHTASFLDSSIFEEMKPFISDKWGHYLQVHQKGKEVFSDVFQAYEILYKEINAEPKEDTIIFTSSGEEAISQMFHIVYENAVKALGKNHLLSIQSEDAPILMNLKKLEALGCKTIHLKLDDPGLINIEKISESITPRCALVSLSLASGLTGLIQPIEKLKEICHLRGIYLHLDVSYAIGKMEIDVDKLGVDFLTFSGDKFHGPKSSGALYVRSGIKISPLICGSLEQNGYRGGALDTAQLVGLSKALQLANQNINEMCLEVASNRDLLERYLEEGLEDIHILFNKAMRLPNVCVISFKGVHADALLYSLSQKGVYATLGGAQFQKLSLLLESLGQPYWIADNAISFALSRFTTAEEVVKASEIIIEEVLKLRKLSTKLQEEHELKSTH